MSRLSVSAPLDELLRHVFASSYLAGMSASFTLRGGDEGFRPRDRRRGEAGLRSTGI